MTYEDRIVDFTGHGRAFPMDCVCEEIHDWRESELSLGDAVRAGCPVGVNPGMNEGIDATFGAFVVSDDDDEWICGMAYARLADYSDDRMEEIWANEEEALQSMADAKLVVGGELADRIESIIRDRLENGYTAPEYSFASVSPMVADLSDLLSVDVPARLLVESPRKVTTQAFRNEIVVSVSARSKEGVLSFLIAKIRIEPNDVEKGFGVTQEVMLRSCSDTKVFFKGEEGALAWMAEALKK